MVVNDAVTELAMAARLAAVVPTQRALLAHPLTHAGADVTVWSWLHGQPLTGADAHAQGAILRRLHDHAQLRAAEVSCDGDQLASARARMRNLGYPATRAVLTALLDRAGAVLTATDQGEAVLSHGGAHDANMLLVDGVVHLLDFDTTGPAPRLLDVASGLYSWALRHPDLGAARAFLAGYGPHPSVDPAALAALIWVRRVRGTCTRAANGQDVTARIGELATIAAPTW